MTNLKYFLGSSSFWMLNKQLVTHIGNHISALILTDLISRREYFRDKGELDEEGGFFVLAKDLEEDLVITERIRKSSVRKLVELGLITTKQKKIPYGITFAMVTVYVLNDSNILEIFKSKKSNNINGASPVGAQSPQKGPANNTPPPPGNGERSSPDLKATATPDTLADPEAITTSYLANVGDIDFLKDRIHRNDRLQELAYEMKLNGIPEDVCLTSSQTIMKYAVPARTTKNKQVVREWEKDFERQWEITVKSVFLPPKKSIHEIEQQNKEINTETLNLDVGNLLGE